MRSALHVVVGKGPLGRAVVRALQARRARVRLVSRRGHDVTDGGAEAVAADATDRRQMQEACSGASVVYHCAQPPYARWPKLAPPLMEGVLHGAEAAGARLVYGDNLYMYGRVDGRLHEGLPNRPVGSNGRVRAALAEMVLDAHAGGRVPAAIARASDFYGPFVTNSTLGERVFGRAVHGQSAQVLGDPDALHSYTFTDDFGEALVLLGDSDGALGQVWHVPSGEPSSARAMATMAYRELGREPKLSVMPTWLFRLGGVLDPTLRALGEVLYQSQDPWLIDSGKFERRFGDIATPRQEAVARTVRWYRDTAEAR
jgi:nucleoside-diphosphate-sugar epimerase